MEIYIISKIYTSENCAALINTTIFKTYPHAAGTEEGVVKELNRLIENAKSKGLSAEEITSESIHAGQYFDRVVRIQQTLGPDAIYGIHSVWEVK